MEALNAEARGKILRKRIKRKDRALGPEARGPIETLTKLRKERGRLRLRTRWLRGGDGQMTLVTENAGNLIGQP